LLGEGIARPSLGVRGGVRVATQEPEAIDFDAQARFDDESERRLEQLRTELDLTFRANAILAAAAGLDASKIPPESLRGLEEAAEEVSKAEPPPLPRD
jgi:hypothetical protein